MPSNQFNREVRGRGAARSSTIAAGFLGRDMPPCPYPSHRDTDWQLEHTTPVICGVCHPPAPPNIIIRNQEAT